MIRKLSFMLVAMLIIAGQSLQAQEEKAKTGTNDADVLTAQPAKTKTVDEGAGMTTAQPAKTKTVDEGAGMTTAQTPVTTDNFHDKAESLIGQEVEIQGMVTHVCKHGGKKMFLNTNKEDINVKITTGENVAAFSTELEGSTVWVRGTVEMMEIEVEGPAEAEGEKHEEDEAHRNIYHKKQYSIKALKYKVVE